MGLFQRLFGKKNKPPETAPTVVDSVTAEKTAVSEEWQELPFYVTADVPEKELVTVVATAIAAGDQPNSQFVVKKIQVKNPEAQLVSLIATSIAAGDQPDSQFIVKKIYQRK